MGLKYALSNHDIFQLLKGKCNVITYSELSKYNTIEQALGKNGCLVILYETEPNFGHWTCVFYSRNQRGKKIISWFDSYGLYPDDEVDFIDNNMRKLLTGGEFYLSKLLSNTQYPVEYNEFPLQEMKDGVNTCGKWAVARILLRDLPVEDFYYLFRSGKNFTSDQLVDKFIETLQ
jgi:hypothetical protein